MTTRDQWYKPNLLYNIHYRQPIKVEPPKIIVETFRFNPSVCTCGKQGCEPKYRMEKKVLWTNKEKVNYKQVQNIEEKIVGGKCLEDEEKISSDVSVAGESKSGTDNERIYTSVVGGRGSNDGHVRNDNGCGVPDKKIYTDTVAHSCIDNRSVKCDSGGAIDNDEMFTDGVSVRDDGNGHSVDGYIGSVRDDCISGRNIHTDSVGNQCIDFSNDIVNKYKDASLIRNGYGCRDGAGLVNTQDDSDINCTSANGEKECGKEECFGWNDISSNGDYYDTDGDRNPCIARSNDGTVEHGNDEGRIVERGDSSEEKVGECDEEVGECYSEESGWYLQDEEISSAFGIMSIYCNSELHSWKMIKDEDKVQ